MVYKEYKISWSPMINKENEGEEKHLSCSKTMLESSEKMKYKDWRVHDDYNAIKCM